MKKIIKEFWILAILLSVALSGYANEFEVNGIHYGINRDGKTVYVSSCDNNYNGSVVIPSTVTDSGTTYSVTEIGDAAFRDCSGLTSVTIPNSVTSIGDEAFSGCSGLTSVTIPNSVTSIGYEAFYNCRGLTKVEISDIAAWCNISFGNDVANPLYYAHHLYQNGKEVSNLVIPNSVTSIGYKAFYNCSGLTSVTIPNSVTSIGSDAFYECSGLTSVVFNAENCTSMGSSNYPVFYNCSNLTSLTIGENVKTIPDFAFEYCRGLTSVTIPNSVTSIGSRAFYVCRGLTSVTIPNSVTSIGSYAFSGCSELTSVTIPNSVTSIASYTFEYCRGLTSVTIPNSVTSIGSSAFENCSGLTDLTIGSSVNSIGASAFDVARLGRIKVLNPVPPTCVDNTVFKSVDKENCLLTVPHGTIDLYSTTYVWWDFKRMKEDNGQGDIATIDSDSVRVTAAGGAIRVEGAEGAEAEVYSLSGALLYRGTDSTIALPRGIYVVKVAGTTTKVIL